MSAGLQETLPGRTNEPIAARLGRYVASVRVRPLPRAVLEKAATCLLDTVGLGVAARVEPATVAFLRTLPPGSAARLWAADGTASLSDAVTANAFAAHARFQDDCDMASWSHPGSLVVPVVLSTAEALGANMDVVLRGVVAGYSVINWLGSKGLIGHAMVERGFRTSPTLGPLGAAAGASVVLGLPATAAAHALAMAAGVAGGAIDTVRAGSSDFRLQNAIAAWQGLTAAQSAREGLDGSPTIFDGPGGFLASFAGQGAPDQVLGDPSPDSILEVWAKPFPALGDNMAVLVAAVAAGEQGYLDPGRVISVRVHQNAQFAAYPGTAYRGPYERPAQAIASAPYGVAATLVRGRLRYGQYLEQLEDPAVMALIARTEIIPEESYGFLDGMVEVVFADGECRVGRTEDLPSSLFFRDRDSTVDAVSCMFGEAGLDVTPVRSVVGDLFERIAAGRLASLLAKELLDGLRMGAR